MPDASPPDRAAPPDADPEDAAAAAAALAADPDFAAATLQTTTSPADEEPATLRDSPQSGPTLVGPAPIDPFDPRPTAPADEDEAAIDALAASWRQPVLPAGESPWSEVVSTRGAHHRSHATFPGIEWELPVQNTKPRAPSPSPSPTPLEIDEEVEPEIVDAISGFNWKKVVSGVVAVLVIFGLFALIARSGGDDETGEFTVAHSMNAFHLDSRPSAATVIAAADGRVLGKTPLSFLVPNATRSPIILAAPGHEPLEIDLVRRGKIVAELTPLKAQPCEVTLRATDGARLEGIGFDAGATDQVTVPGAGVVRAAEGQRVRGARVVRCPEIGGGATQQVALEPVPQTVAVRLTEPAGTAAYMNGDPIGRVPTLARAQTAFVHMRVDDASGMSEERWVPTHGSIEVRMPTPKARKLPILVVPDNAPTPSAGPPVAPPPQDEVDDSTDDDTVEEDSAPPRRRRRRMSKRQRRAKARELLDAGTRDLVAGKTKPARAKLRSCLKYDARLAECHRELGTLYRRLRNPQLAKKYYLEYLRLKPNASDASTIRRMLE
ncbi:MAG: hypothetical protein RMA76_46240 [Deltaproteobacteria bacterium]